MKILLPLLIILTLTVKNYAQQKEIKQFFFNLYTDSLKKGTYNYINVDAQLKNGRYTPLDSTTIILKSSAGIFSGNSLYIDSTINQDSVIITATLINDITIKKEIVLYIKKGNEAVVLSTEKDIINTTPTRRKRNR